MANFIYITLDTTAPSNPIINISGGAVYTTNQLVNLNISVDDVDKTGYQMLIWGNVDETYNTNIKTTEGTSSWMPFNASPQVRLGAGDGSKTINIRVRDDVHNSSGIAVDSISMDTSLPTVTVTTADVAKISKVAGKNTFSFTFSSNEDFKEYKVKLVSATGATENTGTTILTEFGSTNTSAVGSFTSGQVITVTVNGLDLEYAGATTDGQKIVKIFVKDSSGQWSV